MCKEVGMMFCTNCGEALDDGQTVCPSCGSDVGCGLYGRAEAEPESAKAEAESAKAEAENAKAEAESAKTEAESAKAEPEYAKAEPENAQAQAQADAKESDFRKNKIVEGFRPDKVNGWPGGKKNIRSRIIAGVLCFLLIIAIILCLAQNLKYTAAQEEYDALFDENEALEAENTDLNDQVTDLNSEISKLEEQIETLESEIDELENGASSQLTEIKNAYEDGDWQTVIDLADALHESYNGSEEDEEAQALAQQAQEKLDEEAASEAEEEAKGYDTGITYEDLARYPDEYEGQKVKLTGTVVQVVEGSSTISIRMAVNGDYDCIIYGQFDEDILEARLLEDDTITIYGTSVGTVSYESVLGAAITIPGILIDKIDQ